jgi:hypothetical protein
VVHNIFIVGNQRSELLVHSFPDKQNILVPRIRTKKNSTDIQDGMYRERICSKIGCQLRIAYINLAVYNY